MANNPEFYAAVLGFVVFSIPIIGALWKIFNVRSELQAEILANRHRVELLEQNVEHLIDQQTLALNNLKEMAQHTRSRSQHAEQLLDARLSDLEGFVEKTTAFTKRSRG